MIFPDARLEGGENWIEAHVPIDVPSTVETDERLRWLQFYGNPATEHLFVVLTREPLARYPHANTEHGQVQRERRAKQQGEPHDVKRLEDRHRPDRGRDEPADRRRRAPLEEGLRKDAIHQNSLIER